MGGSQNRFLVVDDHISVSEGLAALIQQHQPAAKLFIANSAAEALETIKSNRIDAVLIDARMPGMSGIELMLLLKREYPTIKLIGMTSFDEDTTVVELLRAGVPGILLKRSTNGQEIKDCLHAVLAGEIYFSAEVKEKLTQNGYNLIKPTLRFTKREQDLLTLMCEGQSTKQIAEKLSLQPSTVEEYRKALLKKTGTKNTTELVALVLRNGFL
jgi:DNA-binding NarL/FixJ family response regulator